YEEGMTTVEYDKFFAELREELVPFVLSATANKKPHPKKLTKGFFSKEKQKAFSEYLTGVFSYDMKHAVLKESAHPFTSNNNTYYVRITSRYIENILESSIFSTIHEMGHAIYEQQVDATLNGTRLTGGASMGIHESQSRMYENMIGRS